ncbi:B3 domain-containing protein REM20-like [Chenopodium quinoa]|uniref:B3 domain-containing protein REM20-like n=1 Tax=Chenopodium quinoa TaxID=63459 RepID=UPI000B77B038|nr:B3 domain-containing protein REM20-like [Chenopodium quinoa]
MEKEEEEEVEQDDNDDDDEGEADEYGFEEEVDDDGGNQSSSSGSGNYLSSDDEIYDSKSSIDSDAYRRSLRNFDAENSKNQCIPNGFEELLNDGNLGVELSVHSDSRLWYVTMVHEEENEELKVILGDGWSKFVKENSLKAGDVLNFSYSGHNSFLIQIFRRTTSKKSKQAKINVPLDFPKKFLSGFGETTNVILQNFDEQFEVELKIVSKGNTITQCSLKNGIREFIDRYNVQEDEGAFIKYTKGDHGIFDVDLNLNYR